MTKSRFLCIAVVVGMLNLGMVTIECDTDNFSSLTVVEGHGTTSNKNDFEFQFGVWAVDSENNPVFLLENYISEGNDDLDFDQIGQMPYWDFTGELGPPQDPGFWNQSPETQGSGGAYRTPDHYLMGFNSPTDNHDDGPFAVWPGP